MDNFIRKDGKIFWIDGNIIAGDLAKSDEDVFSFLEKMRNVLSGFVKK